MLKTSRPPEQIAPGWAAPDPQQLDRCVRRSYRLDLIAPGQPCLLWLSGPDRPGVHALGEVTDSVEERADGPVLHVRLALLDRHVPRAELLADRRMRDAEVLRMPAGSNPSWLSAAQFAAVLDRTDRDGLGRWAP
ncbi:hypothetical protein ACI78T_12485 [Blastococcus sp. SYSU D00922]